MQNILTDLSAKKLEMDCLIGLAADRLVDLADFRSSASKMSLIFFGRKRFEADG
jgi:hypothetical protein